MKIVLLGANGQLGQTFLREGSLATLGDVIPVTRDGNVNGHGPGEASDLSAPDDVMRLADLRAHLVQVPRQLRAVVEVALGEEERRLRDRQRVPQLVGDAGPDRTRRRQARCLPVIIR